MDRHRMRMSLTRCLGALTLLTALSLLFAPGVIAQSVGFSGFIKSSYYYDTQQVVAGREGDLLLYPAFSDEDGDGENDARNETDNLLFFPFFTRVAMSVGDLPRALGAEVTGLIETDFFGPSNETLNTLRIRRAFVRMDWGDREALFGMEWSPFFLTSSPRTVASESGAPFNPFARYPMVRYTLKPENFRISGILAQQRDAFEEIGGRKQQQQAGLPAAMLSAEFGSGGNTLGANAAVKWIRPTLTSDRFMSGAIQGFANIARPGFEARGNVTYGGDLADHLMTGGYAVVGPNEFEPLNVLAAWVDVQTTGPLSVGVFGGYLQNLGTNASGLDPGSVTFAARGYGGTNAIEHLWRLAPRLNYTTGPVRFGAEVQATGARYAVGNGPAAVYDDSLRPDGAATDDVVNVRGNLSVFLIF